MAVTTTLRTLSFDDAAALVAHGAAFVDLRPVDAYLEVHIPGSLALLYEAGPGMPARARDCLPLDLPLVILDEGVGDPVHTSASLRGKGFTVLGKVDDAIGAWASARGAPASTEIATGANRPAGVVLDVGDPGAPAVDDAVRIPAERLWYRATEVAGDDPVVVVAGYGVRAALAVGMLERAGASDVVFWKASRG